MDANKFGFLINGGAGVVNLVLLFIEFQKFPGFGWPKVVTILCAAISFYISYQYAKNI